MKHALILLFTTLFIFPLLAAHADRTQEPTPVPPTIQVQQATPATTPSAQTPEPNRSTQTTAPATATQEKAPRITGTINGRVVGDAGEPIPGVSVYALLRAAGMGRTPQVVTADEGGNFQLSGLEPGLYLLNASMPGYVSETDPLTGQTGNLYRPGDTATVRLVHGGVITGSVTDQQGDPLVALSVRAVRVRDLDGRPPRTPFPYSSEDRTDDRGVYRIYGLQPGLYIVFTGGYSTSGFGPATIYGGDVPTFYPSGTRDTASEVSVRSGQESSGIDIRYRDEQGHRVTGTVEIANAAPGDFGTGILLTYASTGMPAGGTSVNLNSNERSFSIEGVADGDYDLQATSGGRDGLTSASVSQRISVRGTDVTGLRVTLTPLASVSGTLIIEPATDADRARDACKSIRATQLPQETLVTAALDRDRAQQQQQNRPFSRISISRETTPDASGSFTLRSLEPGRYRLAFRLFDESLYVRSIQLPGAPPASAATPTSQRAIDTAPQRATNSASQSASQRTTNSSATQRTGAQATAARDLFELRSGQQLSGVSIHLAEGAASFVGRIVAAEGAAPPPFAQMRVHLVPQERERDDDPLRFYETAPASDGTFTFKNLAPGRYLVLAREVNDTRDTTPRPAALDTDARAKLRREAEAVNNVTELQPCQRTNDFTLRFPPPTTK